jgi:integrase
VFPKFGKWQVAAVDTPAVLEVLKPIAATKTGKNVRTAIEQVLNSATARGLRTGDNPARWAGHLEHLLPKRTATVKHHDALPWREMPAFMTRLRAPSDTFNLDALALEFLILTAARTNEVLQATWDEIVGDTWIVPPQRAKTGKEHRVPLSPRALDLLAALPRDGGRLIFPGAREGQPLSHSAMLRVLERLGVQSTVHGLRSSFRDWAGESTAFPRDVIEQALAHSIGAVEKAYRRGDLIDKRRKLMDAWASYLEKPTTAEVVPIRAA